MLPLHCIFHLPVAIHKKVQERSLHFELGFEISENCLGGGADVGPGD